LKENSIELIVAGKLDEPDYICNMKKQADAIGVGERLKILGPVSEADKAWYYQNCMAFSLPSLAEGFGAPVVEAMKFGKPVFLSARTSLLEIGKDVAFYFNSFEPSHMNEVFSNGIKEYNKNGLALKIQQRANYFRGEEKAIQNFQV